MTDNSQTPTASPLVSYVADGLKQALPAESQSELTALMGQVDTTTSKPDSKRAWACAQWAMKVADTPDENIALRSIHEVEEAYGLLKSVLFGAEFGLETNFGTIGIPSTGVAFDVQLQCADEALKVARHAAQTRGWSEVPWPSLLRDLISMG